MATEATSKRKQSDSAVTPPAATKRVRSSYTDVIKVIVGKEENVGTFLVHKDLLAKQSAFFKAATSNQTWIEAQEKTVKLPEHTPLGFHNYLECLYNHSADPTILAQEASEDVCPPESKVDREYSTTDELAKMWVLGDYFGDPQFQNRVMKALQTTGTIMRMSTAQSIAKDCVPGSGLWKWVVEYIYRRLRQPTEHSGRQKWIALMPEAIAKEVLHRFIEGSPRTVCESISPDCEDFFVKERSVDSWLHTLAPLARQSGIHLRYGQRANGSSLESLE